MVVAEQGDGLAALPDLAFTDHYIKITFGDATRTYTIRALDRERGEMAVDFVVHGGTGLAGPWAAAAQPGETIAVRHMVYLALTYDHRVVDGADAGRFLRDLKKRLESGQFEV